LATVTMKELLEAGVHFGHQVRRWNPKMKEYIFGERNGIYIIDLQKTQRMFKEALKYVTNLASEGSDKIFLFVGTKRQAQDAIKEEAARCNQFYVNQRWLGGLLTNFQTIQKSIKRYKEIEAMQADGRIEQYAKKERLQIERERQALEKNLSGIKEMRRLPDAIFIIDTNKEEIAVKEANRLNIPVVADGISQVIPGNDDALRAVRLFAARIADAIIEGQAVAQAKEAEEAAQRAEQGITMEQAAPRERRPRGERGERGERRGERGERGDRRPRGDQRGGRGERRPQSDRPAAAPVAPQAASVSAEAPTVPAEAAAASSAGPAEAPAEVNTAPVASSVESAPAETVVAAPETSETNAA
jgi:small subunit ribosomal protein S2